MKDRFLFVLIVVIDVLLGISTVNRISICSNLAFVLLLYLILKGNAIQAFYAVLGTCFFSDTVNLGSIGTYFVIMFVAGGKIGGYGFRNYTLPVFIILILYAIHDIFYTSFAWVLFYLSYLYFLFKVLTNLDFKKYNHLYAVGIFLVSVILVQIFSICLSGDLASFGDDSIEYARLGEGDVEDGYNNNLDGAMGFPITSMLFLTISLPILLGKRMRKKFKLFLGFLVIALFVATFFTASKVYLLGLACLLVCLLCEVFGSELRFSSKIGIVSFCIIAVIVLIQSGYLDIIVHRYIFRLTASDDVTTGRSRIYSDCLSYLSTNPLPLIFGSGYRGYCAIGASNGLKFSMSAHNIILDCIMAYGLFGAIIILCLCRNFYRSVKVYCGGPRMSMLGLMPFICWFVMNFTNSSFMLAKTYVVIPFLILHMKYYRKLYYDKTFDELQRK